MRQMRQYKRGSSALLATGTKKRYGQHRSSMSMMMDFNMMSGAYGPGMMFWGWVLYVLVVVALVLSMVALWKYVRKK